MAKMPSAAYIQLGKDVEHYIAMTGRLAWRYSRVSKIFQPALIVLAVLA